MPTSSISFFPDLDSQTRYVTELRGRGLWRYFIEACRSGFPGKFSDQYQRDLPNSDRFSDCLLRLPAFSYELQENDSEVEIDY
jgi:dTDP-4-amino-4,6-dideoxygalactose transaminase